MENRELKNIWKAQVDGQIQPLSEAELNGIVVKKARRSIGKYYPFFMGLCGLVAGFQIWRIIQFKYGVQMLIFDWFILVSVLSSLVCMIYSLRKMTRYETDKSVKDWLQYRMDAMDKSIRLKKKYNWLVLPYVALLLVWVNLIQYNMFGTPLLKLAVMLGGELLFCLALLLFTLKWEKRHNEKLRDYLYELYEQIKE